MFERRVRYMSRSGSLSAKNDAYIEMLLNDPRYKIKKDGTILTILSWTGKISKRRVWRKAGSLTQVYNRIKYTVGGKTVGLLIHRIIYRKFVGPLSHDLMINHKNGNSLDNSPENLELITQAENNLHKFRVLKHKQKGGRRKISYEIAEQIRLDYKNGIIGKALYAKYQLSQANISYIVNNKIWTTK